VKGELNSKGEPIALGKGGGESRAPRRLQEKLAQMGRSSAGTTHTT